MRITVIFFLSREFLDLPSMILNTIKSFFLWNEIVWQRINWRMIFVSTNIAEIFMFSKKRMWCKNTKKWSAQNIYSFHQLFPHKDGIKLINFLLGKNIVCEFLIENIFFILANLFLKQDWIDPQILFYFAILWKFWQMHI